MITPKILILRTAGTNCDWETKYAFEKARGYADRLHINQILENKKVIHNYHIIVIPGGFSYGDDIAAGKIFANEFYFNLKDSIKKFIDDGKLILGICNGFQVLVKVPGLLPGLEDSGISETPFQQQVTLTFNDSGRFEARWVYLKACSDKSPFVNEGDRLYLPVANGEGKFIPRDENILTRLNESRQVILRYVNKDYESDGYPWDPSGSIDNIAGICDTTGQVFGLMPHPERHIEPTQHPRWTREGLKYEGDGIIIFRNAVNYIKDHWS